MKKKYLLLTSFLVSSFAFTQVGINTSSPNTTLDVSKKMNGTSLDLTHTHGLQAPRLTRAELTNVTATYGTNQNGALIYITDVSDGNATAGTPRVNITAPGYYYFDAVANVWQVLKPTEPWRVMGSETEATLNTQSIYQRAFVGIGDFRTPGFVPYTALHILGKGLADDDIILESRNDIAAYDAILRFTKKLTDGSTPTVPTIGQHTLGTINYSAGGSINNAQIKAALDPAIDATNNYPTSIRFSTSSTNMTATERLRITGNGNVGIGTNNPQQKLDVNGTLKVPRITNGNANVTTSDLGLYNQTNTWLRFATPSSTTIAFFTDAAAGNNFAGSNNPSMVVVDTRVGIGTTAPQNKLHVNGDARITSMVENNLDADKAVTVSTDGVLKKVDPKVFLDGIDQTINFRSTANSANLTANGTEDVIWFAGNPGNLTLVTPTDAQIRRGRITHIIAAAGPVNFLGLRPVVTNGFSISSIPYGHRISIVPVEVFGGKAWYVVASSMGY
ncbi:hypothetical protein ACKW6Q_15990 [Chryseobacterium kwangjuense]|uniref:Uncharacterized protein n=1 Tax=Chryseobacterium kwangjuense TaxID=267125 RepID=A0ABW9K7V0_9FLAO